MTLHKDRCECCVAAQKTIDKLRDDIAKLRVALRRQEVKAMAHANCYFFPPLCSKHT